MPSKDSQESSPTPQFKSISSLVLSFLYGPTLTSKHDYRKNCSLTIWTFVSKVISLLLNILSSFVIAFLPRRKCLLISWLKPPSVLMLEPRKVNFVTVSIVSPSIFHEVMELDAIILIFECRVLSQLFHSPLPLFIKRLFSSLYT